MPLAGWARSKMQNRLASTERFYPSWFAGPVFVDEFNDSL